MTDRTHYCAVWSKIEFGLWSDGGAGLLITGNIQIDRNHLERLGNVVLHHGGWKNETDEDAVASTAGKLALKNLADAVASTAGKLALKNLATAAMRNKPGYSSLETFRLIEIIWNVRVTLCYIMEDGKTKQTKMLMHRLQEKLALKNLATAATRNKPGYS